MLTPTKKNIIVGVAGLILGYSANECNILQVTILFKTYDKHVSPSKYTDNFQLNSFLRGNVSAAEALPATTPAATVSSSARVSQIMKHGFPGYDNVRSYSDYVISYDRRNKVAHWVFEHLTPELVKKSPGVDRAQCEFKEDTSIHAYFRYLIQMGIYRYIH